MLQGEKNLSIAWQKKGNVVWDYRKTQIQGAFLLQEVETPQATWFLWRKETHMFKFIYCIKFLQQLCIGQLVLGIIKPDLSLFFQKSYSLMAMLTFHCVCCFLVHLYSQFWENESINKNPLFLCCSAAILIPIYLTLRCQRGNLMLNIGSINVREGRQFISSFAINIQFP